MPNTWPLNDEHDITTRADGVQGGAYRATAEVFRRTDNAQVGPTFYGEGRSLSAAEGRALAEARRWFFTQPRR